MSVFPIECVTCRVGGDTRKRLFLKYQSNKSHSAHGHRAGIGHEAEVYRRILASRKGSRPRFFGLYIDERTGEQWLALEELDRARQVHLVRVDGKGVSLHAAMILASRWIARLHADCETPASQGAFEFLRRYDAEYYAGWARRTGEFTDTLQARYPWLAGLCARGEELLAPLLTDAPTVIHGEFYTNNILLRRGNIHVVDWEAAAIGSGAIDLAALTDGWAAPIVHSCEAEYRATRWPRGEPPEFERPLEAARLYWQFRWLGDRLERTLKERSAWRFEQLRVTAARLGHVFGDQA